ncbi:MAG: DHHW family protein [Oscillospiraceae bacterium]
MNFKKVTIGLFFTIIVLMSLATFLLPKKSFSQLENRSLARTPRLTADSFFDKSFMENAESFMADHIVFRGGFSSAQTRLEMLIGKREINGVFIAEDMLLENIQEPSEVITKSNVEAINKFAKKYSGIIDTQMMLVPTALEFYKVNAPPMAKVFDQTAYIKTVYDKLETVTTTDAYSSLASSTDDYIFYRTDHHWTSYGSYVGYSTLAKSLGLKPATIDMFNIEHASHDFLGTLYSKIIYGEKLVDNIDLYHYAQGDVVTDVIKYTDKNTQTYPSIFFKENLEIKDKYTVFLGENSPVVKIKTSVTNGKKIIIFKDSYAHSLMQFLPLHYEEILLVDLRYLHKPIEEYAKVTDYEQALFLYNAGGFAKDSSVKQVSLF